MKYLFSLVVCIVMSFVTNAQEIPPAKPFQDGYLYVTKVILDSGKTQKEIMSKIKNWAGITFKSSKTVIQSETEDQLVISFIIRPDCYFKNFGLVSHNDQDFDVRFVLQVKDNKYKVSVIDEGNEPSIILSAGRCHIVDHIAYFSKNPGDKPETEKDLHKLKGYTYGFILSWEKQVDEILSSLETYLKEAQVKNDW